MLPGQKKAWRVMQLNQAVIPCKKSEYVSFPFLEGVHPFLASV